MYTSSVTQVQRKRLLFLGRGERIKFVTSRGLPARLGLVKLKALPSPARAGHLALALGDVTPADVCRPTVDSSRAARRRPADVPRHPCFLPRLTNALSSDGAPYAGRTGAVLTISPLTGNGLGLRSSHAIWLTTQGSQLRLRPGLRSPTDGDPTLALPPGSNGGWPLVSLEPNQRRPPRPITRPGPVRAPC